MQAPRPFDLDLTVRSHGFYDLAPWSYDGERHILSRPLRVARGRVVAVDIAPGSGPGELALRIAVRGKLSAAVAAEARAAVRTCLALDEDLEPFYRLTQELPSSGRGPRALPDSPLGG